MWLFILILLSFAMILVGGATRLTESGLSITQWDLVMGSLPPLSDADWAREFDFYRQSSQYELMNRGMTLAEFKAIYWWEWSHRELGRFIGLFYIAGLLVLTVRRKLSPGSFGKLLLIGVLLGAQGVVGWIMVASGLEPGMTSVEPVRLTLHLLLACLFFVAIVAMFVRLGGARADAAGAGIRIVTWLLVALGIAQVGFGGLMAGHDAGLTYNSWPLMDGQFFPPGLDQLEPLWRNLFENITAIQFNHRIGAYVLAAAVFAYAIASRRAGPAGRGRAFLMVLVVLAQLALGVATLMAGVPIALALAHQGLAFILMLVLTWNAAVFRAPYAV